MRRAVVLGMLAGRLGSLSMTAAAMQQPPAGQQAPRVVEIEKLKDNLYVMKGGGGQQLRLHHRRRRGRRRHEESRLGAAAARRDQEGDRPAGHDDHQHAHARRSRQRQRRVPRRSATSSPHENTAANMKADAAEFVGRAQPESAEHLHARTTARGWPKRTFSDQMTIGSGAEQIDLMLLRPRPHQRRRHGLLPGASRAAHRRRVPGQGAADHGLEQRRHRRRLRRHADEGSRRSRRRTPT